jgi:hypothetical protein
VEMFSMGLKATGSYLSRTLSYRDAEFRLEQVEIDAPFRCVCAGGGPGAMSGRGHGHGRAGAMIHEAAAVGQGWQLQFV